MNASGPILRLLMVFVGPYPPMPRFPGAWKGRIADDELFNDDEDFSMLRKRKKMDKAGSAEWERVGHCGFINKKMHW